jgi:hypothetical protein
METRILKDEDLLDIVETTQVKEYDKDSKMAGQKYKIYSFDGKGFIVNVADRFNKLYADGKLGRVKIGINEEGKFSLLSCASVDQLIGAATTKRKLDVIKNAPVEASKEELALILGASPM